MLTSLPNLLTLSRIGVIPLFAALIYVEGDAFRWIACVLFSSAGFTDLLDGYVARLRSQQTSFGRFLDPVADKLLVATALFMLVAARHIEGWVLLPALIILVREILVSGLREYLAELRVGLPVSRLAKWKTAIQMVAIGVLIVGDSGPAIIPVRLIGELGLWTAAVLTLVTGYDYVRASMRHMGPAGKLRRRRRGGLGRGAQALMRSRPLGNPPG